MTIVLSTTVTDEDLYGYFPKAAEQFCGWISQEELLGGIKCSVSTILFQPICLPPHLAGIEEKFSIKDGGDMLHIAPEVDRRIVIKRDDDLTRKLLFEALKKGVSILARRRNFPRDACELLAFFEDFRGQYS